MNVFFDFDSTIIRIESLDELIGRALTTEAKRDAICKITEQGMNGEIDFNTSLKLRLEAVSLSKKLVEDISKELPSQFTNGMKNFIHTLHAGGHNVHILTGGFVDYLLPSAEALGIPKTNLHGNKFIWKGDKVNGFDNTSLLAHSGGKGRTIQSLCLKSTEVVMVGDGATDLEAYEQKFAGHFIGFGEHAVREKVQKNAPHFVHSVTELENAFNMICHPELDSGSLKTQKEIES